MLNYINKRKSSWRKTFNHNIFLKDLTKLEIIVNILQ